MNACGVLILARVNVPPMFHCANDAPRAVHWQARFRHGRGQRDAGDAHALHVGHCAALLLHAQAGLDFQKQFFQKIARHAVFQRVVHVALFIVIKSAVNVLQQGGGVFGYDSGF